MRLIEGAASYKRIMGEWAKGVAYFAGNPDARVRLGGWAGQECGLDDFRRAMRAAIHRGINAKGGCLPREPRDGTVQLRRDQRAIHDNLRHRIVPRGLRPETRTVQRRAALAALWDGR